MNDKQTSIEWEQDLEFPYFINKNGQTGWIADFLDKFYRNVFEINISMLNNKKRREFPIAYCKTQAIPMFQQAFTQTIENDSCYLGRVETESETQAGKKSKEDLWYCINKQDVLIYLNLKELNLGSKKELELKPAEKDRKCKIKIDIFNIRVLYHYTREPHNLFSHQKSDGSCSQKFFEEKVWSRINLPSDKKFIYAVMDLCPSIHTRKGIPTESSDRDNIVKANPQQIFLEHGKGYKSKADLKDKFLPFMVSVAVIEDLRG